MNPLQQKLNYPQLFLIKEFVNNRISSLPESLRKAIFTSYYPQLDYYEFKNSDIWESLLYNDFQELIEEKELHPSDKEIQIIQNKNLWGKSDPGPVG